MGYTGKRDGKPVEAPAVNWEISEAPAGYTNELVCQEMRQRGTTAQSVDIAARADHFEANWQNAEQVIELRNARIAALESTLTEAIRRLAIAMRMAGPRKGLGYKDLRAVLESDDAPRLWENKAQAKK